MKKVLGIIVFWSMVVMMIGQGAFINEQNVYASGLTITTSGGWFESAFVEWTSLSSATSYSVYVKEDGSSDSTYQQLDTELIRSYGTYWRADALGLSAGNYTMKVEAFDDSDVLAEDEVSGITVTSNDRSGFAFSSSSEFETGSGAYQEDGTLKSGAQVIYVTGDTADSVTLDVVTSSSGTITTGTGIGEILRLRQKGYDTTPLDIRFIGQITEDDMDGELNSNGYLQVKGKSSYKEMNMTLEGVGEDATAYGWGILIRNSGNVEVRNLGIMLFPDDGISLDTDNENIWIHNNDIFYGTAGSDADQAKGDGSVDVKSGSTYVTIAYNHFWDSGKCSLCGMSDTEEFFVTYHHNWFDHSDSRHPRIRVASVHIYNNYFDGNSKYGVGTTKGSSAFVESNVFRHVKYPMMSSLQGTDALGDGTFSGEDGGMIKAYNNSIIDASSLIYANSDTGTSSASSTSFDAYLVSSRSEEVPSSYVTLEGGTSYNNFDTSIDIGVSSSDIDGVSDVESVVTSSAGRMNQGDFEWSFDDSEDDEDYSVNTELMSQITSYTSELVSIGGEVADESDNNSGEDPGESTSTDYEQNFTTDGLDSDFYTISGNLSTSKGTVTYDGLTLTQCLKMESATTIDFTTTESLTLTMVFNDGDDARVKVDGSTYTMSDGILEISLDVGSHTIRKGDTANLYYMNMQ